MMQGNNIISREISPLGRRDNSNSLTRGNVYQGLNEEFTPENLEQMYRPFEVNEFKADVEEMCENHGTIFGATSNEKMTSSQKQTNIKKNFFAAIDNVLGGGQPNLSNQIAENM